MNRRAFLIVGLGFGDEGKGTIIDYLARRYNAHTVIRFNGGPQAAHHVVTDDGRAHCFSQFGSATLIDGVCTYLSRFMLLDPLALINENDHLKQLGITDGLKRLTIDKDSLIVTPFQKLINRMQEIARGDKRHGSCGMGVGATVTDSIYLKDRALRAGDLLQPQLMREKLKFLRYLKLDLAEQLINEQPGNEKLQSYYQQLSAADYMEKIHSAYSEFARDISFGTGEVLLELLSRPGTVIFEGAQGVLLDINYGFWPHVTKTRTNFENAEVLLKEANYAGEVSKIGVLRAYTTRHGAGPFVSEDNKLLSLIPACHNRSNEWQGDFRLGWFDIVATRYACGIAQGLQSIAITNLDRLQNLAALKVAVAYENGGALIDEIRFCKDMDRRLKLTGMLTRCQPRYQELDFNPCLQSGLEEYSRYLAQILNKPLSILSFGPRACDKINF